MPIFVQQFFLHGPIPKFSIFPRSIVNRNFAIQTHASFLQLQYYKIHRIVAILIRGKNYFAITIAIMLPYIIISRYDTTFPETY